MINTINDSIESHSLSCTFWGMGWPTPLWPLLPFPSMRGSFLLSSFLFFPLPWQLFWRLKRPKVLQLMVKYFKSKTWLAVHDVQKFLGLKKQQKLLLKCYTVYLVGKDQRDILFFYCYSFLPYYDFFFEKKKMIDDTVRWCNLVGEYLKKRKERSQEILSRLCWWRTLWLQSDWFKEKMRCVLECVWLLLISDSLFV